jgi:hypothetical protein
MNYYHPLLKYSLSGSYGALATLVQTDFLIDLSGQFSYKSGQNESIPDLRRQGGRFFQSVSRSYVPAGNGGRISFGGDHVF